MLGVFKSSNYGSSISMSNSGLTSAWIQAFAIYQGKIFAGNGEEGVYLVKIQSNDLVSTTRIIKK